MEVNNTATMFAEMKMVDLITHKNMYMQGQSDESRDSTNDQLHQLIDHVCHSCRLQSLLFQQ